MMLQVLRMIKSFLTWLWDRRTNRKTNLFPCLPFSQYIILEFLSSQELQITLSKAILWLCLAFISALILLHREFSIDIKSVSSQRFTSLPVVFVICIMFSFAGAFSGLLIRKKPKLAALRRCYFIFSMASMAAALSILGYALFLESFRWVYRGLNCGRVNISAIQN